MSNPFFVETISETPPTLVAITGVPHSMDSAKTRPKFSKLLNKTKYIAKALDNPKVGAEVKGNTVNINTAPNTGFFSEEFESNVIFTSGYAKLSGVNLRAFLILHELGHVGKLYGTSDIDGDGDFESIQHQGKNNEKIRAACFPELQIIKADILKMIAEQQLSSSY